MKNKTIFFSGMICYLDDFKLDIKDFKKKIDKNTFSEEKGNSVEIFQLEFIENHLAINFSDGSSMPRNPNIYDQKTHTIKENPRSKEQIEPKEYFALIDFRTSFLWLSNTKKKSLLLCFLQQFFDNKQIILKDIYDEEDFINCLNTLDGIKVSAVPSLFIDTNTTAKALNDEMYLAAKAELKLTYDRVKILDKLKHKITRILHQKESFQNITISGRDEKGLEMLFNNSLFTRKISFKTDIDDNGMFSPKTVFSKLIVEISNEAKNE